MPNKLNSILIGGLIYGVLGTVISVLSASGGAMQNVGGVLCCLAIVGGAAGAVWHYATTYRLTIPAGQGAALGAGAGVLGAAVSGLLTWLLQLVGVIPDTAAQLERARRDLASQGMSPEQIEMAMQWGEMFSGPIGIVSALVVSALLGALIGAIAALIFKRGDAGADLEAI